MEVSIITASFGVDEQSAAIQALKNWIIEHGHVCGVDATDHLCPKFIMICDDNIDGYRQAVRVFSELWVEFNDVGLSEADFMSAYRAARQKVDKENPI